MTAEKQIPAAWYGTTETKEGKIALICAYCPTRKEAEAAASHLPQSHGVCPQCFPKVLAEAREIGESQ